MTLHGGPISFVRATSPTPLIPPPQLSALAAACRHLLPRPAGASGWGSSRVTLIQGPPGTGKSRTILATLNVLHLAAFQVPARPAQLG